ncbi:putative phytosulfokine [Lupinus albus]|uniref:Phytosulfokine n=1 Tax=Lupinus albus TaxID=3870 RepID=A0A6A4NJM3_LUPAL|nr:putative phytosulfokine [Lupinus albus]
MMKFVMFDIVDTLVLFIDMFQLKDVNEAKVELDNESCEGTEDCLMRRTLMAHLDYIYTEKHKPRT